MPVATGFLLGCEACLEGAQNAEGFVRLGEEVRVHKLSLGPPHNRSDRPGMSKFQRGISHGNWDTGLTKQAAQPRFALI